MRKKREKKSASKPRMGRERWRGVEEALNVPSTLKSEKNHGVEEGVVVRVRVGHRPPAGQPKDLDEEKSPNQEHHQPEREDIEDGGNTRAAEAKSEESRERRKRKTHAAVLKSWFKLSLRWASLRTMATRKSFCS
jgi:hypothetical protein